MWRNWDEDERGEAGGRVDLEKTWEVRHPFREAALVQVERFEHFGVWFASDGEIGLAGAMMQQLGRIEQSLNQKIYNF